MRHHPLPVVFLRATGISLEGFRGHRPNERDAGIPQRFLLGCDAADSIAFFPIGVCAAG